ncbi:MAG: hypothetical protein R2875_11490 [Desulfobacterales bacterium]
MAGPAYRLGRGSAEVFWKDCGRGRLVNKFIRVPLGFKVHKEAKTRYSLKKSSSRTFVKLRLCRYPVAVVFFGVFSRGDDWQIIDFRHYFFSFVKGIGDEGIVFFPGTLDNIMIFQIVIFQCVGRSGRR